MQPFIKLKKNAPSGTIILNRPEKRNAFTRRMLAELLQAFEDFHLERTVRAVILIGAGDVFCSGSDLENMQETAQRDDAQRQWHLDVVQYKELIEFMLRFPKPIIAAVNGPALAAGAGLVLASDIVIAGANASLAFPEVQRGLVSGLAAPLLVYRVGAGPAAQMLLSATPADAEQAFRMHLFHEIVKPDLVWARSHEIAKQCALAAPESLQLTKRLLNETIGEHLGVMLSAGAAASATARTTSAATEGLAAFLDKRTPNWE